MNIYNNNHYEPLTPQTLPFDTYPSQNNNKTINQILPSTTNVLINSPQTPLSYSSNSMNKPSSTLVNLLHQKRPTLVEQSISQEKQTTSIKKTRKTTQKKTQTKQLSTVLNINNNNNLQVNSNEIIFS